MSGRPEISELVMRPLFSQSSGPFDPDLARERAFQVAQMLENHPPIGTNVPQVLGAGIRTALTAK
ncbi:MAG: hypothetical protein GW903_01005 [Alphaproteobacteria bacterium]|nr:hypothetical protein [Alphaproteobacteria bacterium]NCQ87548.1 hypothetical protein [Alphaproteobacteria bacterium]NCT06416.1 hypothetical protein [Alphaproteobacteria bacterium]